MGDHHCPECGTFSVDEPGPLTKRLEEAEATLAERDRLQTLHDASQRALTGALAELADAREENERLKRDRWLFGAALAQGFNVDEAVGHYPNDEDEALAAINKALGDECPFKKEPTP